MLHPNLLPPAATIQKLQTTGLPDFSVYDYFSVHGYSEDISKLNLYYRGLIEDLQE